LDLACSERDDGREAKTQRRLRFFPSLSLVVRECNVDDENNWKRGEGGERLPWAAKRCGRPELKRADWPGVEGCPPPAHTHLSLGAQPKWVRSAAKGGRAGKRIGRRGLTRADHMGSRGLGFHGGGARGEGSGRKRRRGAGGCGRASAFKWPTGCSVALGDVVKDMSTGSIKREGNAKRQRIKVLDGRGSWKARYRMNGG
jgi:hypothetical protein